MESRAYFLLPPALVSDTNCGRRNRATPAQSLASSRSAHVEGPFFISCLAVFVHRIAQLVRVSPVAGSVGRVGYLFHRRNEASALRGDRRCRCGLCVASERQLENKCCVSIPQVVAKGIDSCITDHQHFPSLCLNPAVLEVVYRELVDSGVTMHHDQHK